MAASHLVKKLILLCVVELLFGASIYLAIPTDQNKYIAEIQDKEALLLSSSSPRIIFVGGSNLAFGLDSELVEKEFGLPVINFGLHADLGMETSLNIIAKHAAPGDIIVLVPEYEYFEDSLEIYGSDDILSDFLEINPANIQYIDRNKWFDLPLVTLGIPERKLNHELHSVFTPPEPEAEAIYVRSNFNRYGDMIGHLGKTPLDPDQIPDDAVLRNSTLIPASFDLLEEFHQKIIHKGGIVLFDFPPLRVQNYNNTSSKKFDRLLLALKTQTKIPVMSTPYERCYPYNYFYDSRYHLTEEGREVRTRQVIESLRRILD